MSRYPSRVVRDTSALKADRYITRDGQDPEAPVRARTADRAADIVTIANFVCWQPQRTMWGGVRKEQAEEAIGRVIGISPAQLRRIVGC